MSFKVGDKLVMVRPVNPNCALMLGHHGVVKDIDRHGFVSLQGSGYIGTYSSEQFDLVSTENIVTNSQIRVYVSTPLKPQKFRLEAIQHQVIKQGVFAFIPTTVDTTPEAGAAINKLQIELCDEVWVFGPIGRDCSWEIGYAQGKGKPVKFFESEENKHMVKEDWMLFCAGTEVVKSE